MSVQIQDMHKALMGNGRPGLIEEWNSTKGSINLMKFLFGSSIVVTVISLITLLLKV